MVLPVNIWGTDAGGKAFHQLAYTLDISTGGAKLAGITAALKPGEIIAVRYKQRKSRFRVVWCANQEVGIQYVEGEHFIWIELPEEEFVDREPIAETRRRPEAPPAPPPASEAPPGPAVSAAVSGAPAESKSSAPPQAPSEEARNEEVATALQACLASLRGLDGLVNSAGMIAPVAQEFHAAAGHLRNTAWAVQQWLELHPQSRNDDAMIESVNSERLRFATQLCRELAQDEQRLVTGVSPENREALVTALQLLGPKLGVGLEPQPAASEAGGQPVQRDPVALLAALNQELRSTPLSADETLDLLADRARSFTNADGAAIALRDEEEMTCCASSGMAPLPGVRFSVSGGVAGKAIEDRQISIWQESENDGEAEATLCRGLNLKSSAVAPIVAGDIVMGVLQVFSARVNTFDRTTATLLQHLCEFVASLEPALRVESDAR